MNIIERWKHEERKRIDEILPTLQELDRQLFGVSEVDEDGTEHHPRYQYCYQCILARLRAYPRRGGDARYYKCVRHSMYTSFMEYDPEHPANWRDHRVERDEEDGSRVVAIATRVEDGRTFTFSFGGEKAKKLWERWGRVDE